MAAERLRSSGSVRLSSQLRAFVPCRWCQPHRRVRRRYEGNSIDKFRRYARCAARRPAHAAGPEEAALPSRVQEARCRAGSMVRIARCHGAGRQRRRSCEISKFQCDHLTLQKQPQRVTFRTIDQVASTRGFGKKNDLAILLSAAQARREYFASRARFQAAMTPPTGQRRSHRVLRAVLYARRAIRKAVRGRHHPPSSVLRDGSARVSAPDSQSSRLGPEFHRSAARTMIPNRAHPAGRA
jgi:hypothetical protein